MKLAKSLRKLGANNSLEYVEDGHQCKELWVGRLQPTSQGGHDVKKEKEVGEAMGVKKMTKGMLADFP